MMILNTIRIGLDIDGTVTDPAAFVPALNQSFQKNLTLDDLTSYDLTGVLGITRDEFTEWMKTNEATIYANVTLAENASQVLEKWQHSFELYYVTARGSYLEEITRTWFQTNRVPHHHIELLGQHNKIESIKEHQIDLFLEDKHDNAVEIATHCGIPVLLINTPYNQGDDPKGVIRVNDWLSAEQWVENWIQDKKR
ncbi:hypothetical protein [Alkalicoccobacillus gibsonii]|jgi:uncharacterized protein|uniref:hypothetical protein n=1 Tax=Alkalicoccobacillus gibsonii TaxID=79881 RepID=UPI003513E4BA